jgi:hypothetical protein
MQKDNNNNRKIRTSVEVVDIPPSIAENEMTLKSDNIHDGTTKLTKEDLHHLFQFRNLAFVATLSKNGSPHHIPIYFEGVLFLLIHI